MLDYTGIQYLPAHCKSGFFFFFLQHFLRKVSDMAHSDVQKSLQTYWELEKIEGWDENRKTFIETNLHI